MSGTTEDNILGTIPGIDDSSDDRRAAQVATLVIAGKRKQAAQPTQGAGGGQTSAQPTGQGGAGGTANSLSSQFRRRHDGLVEVPERRKILIPVISLTRSQGAPLPKAVSSAVCMRMDNVQRARTTS